MSRVSSHTDHDLKLCTLWCLGSGRSILNIEDVARQLKAKYKEQATVNVTYVEVNILESGRMPSSLSYITYALGSCCAYFEVDV